MIDIFDSPEVLIGDDGALVSAQSKADRFLSSVFNTILFPPTIPANLDLSPEEEWQHFCIGVGQEWWQAWKRFSNLVLSGYIKLITTLPDAFLNTPWLIEGCKGTLPYQHIKLRHRGTAVWMLCLTNSSLTPYSKWDDYKPYGLQAEALLNLCVAVFEHKSNDCVFHGARGLFTSPQHLWFWCIVARCMRDLRAQGLASPLLSTELQTKQTLLAEDQAFTEWIKQGRNTSDTFCTGWQDFLEHLDSYLLSEALKGRYVENTESNPLDTFVQVHEHTRNAFRRSKKYQGYFLYRFPKDNTTRTFVTEQNIKLPKPKRKPKK